MDCVKNKTNIPFGMLFDGSVAKKTFSGINPELQTFMRENFDVLTKGLSQGKSPNYDIMVYSRATNESLGVELMQDNLSLGVWTNLKDLQSQTKEGIAKSIKNFDVKLDSLRQTKKYPELEV